MTITFLLASDGPRDKAVLPALIRGMLDTDFETEFEPWTDLRLQSGGRGLGGYGRKLLFLLRIARDRAATGVVATVDADKDKTNDKLKDLVAARSRDRAGGNITPAALGEAVPHLEAWLLDDDVAVRAALSLPSTTVVAAPTKVKSPKDELNRLCKSGGINKPIEILSTIASRLKVQRCIRAGDTGFDQFQEDIQNELGPLFAS